MCTQERLRPTQRGDLCDFVPMCTPGVNLACLYDRTYINAPRGRYAAMVSVLDEVIGNLTETLQTAGLWEQTLLVMQSE